MKDGRADSRVCRQLSVAMRLCHVCVCVCVCVCVRESCRCYDQVVAVCLIIIYEKPVTGQAGWRVGFFNWCL